MEKDRITEADIETLLWASNQLEPGEVVTGYLQTSITNQHKGEPKTVKTMIIESSNLDDSPLMAEIDGEGIKGKAIIDAFKKARSNEKRLFNLARTFFSLDAIKTLTNLNPEKAIYSCDEFGRIYLICNGKRIYLNKEKTYGITEDGYFAEIKFIEDDNIEITYYNSEYEINNPEFTNFEYMYVSHSAEKRGEALIQEEALREDNVIDLEAYRRRTEEEGPKR